MGGGVRRRPQRLAAKLLRIREALGLSQGEMARRLGLGDYRHYVSNYENDVREPTLVVLLAYARTANVYADVLIDDELELPRELPCRTTSAGVRRGK